MRKRPWSFFARASFLHQLAATFSIGILCLALLSSIAISTLSSRAVRTKLVEQGLKATETLAGQSTLALLYLSTDNAEEPLRAALAFPDVRGVSIFDTSHNELLSRGEDTIPAAAADFWPFDLEMAHESQDAWYFIAPVQVHRNNESRDSPFQTGPRVAQLIGFVRVKMSKETLKTMESSILRTNLAVSVGLALFLLLLLLAITQRLTTPLKNLADIMRKASSGEKNLRADVRGPKDIIDMEKAFNTMMEVLENRELQLESTRDAALESARIKGEFAANVSHELRTPLNGVLGMLELLQDMGLSPKQDEYVTVARTAGESLLRLIDDILDFSRTDAGTSTFQPIDFSLAEILDEVLGLVASQGQRKALDMGYSIADEVPDTLRGDPARIRQVLVNLVGNAIKFTEHGAIEIKVQSSGDTPEGKALLRFEIVDSGIGIPSEAQRRIFEAFTQADGSTTRTHGGAGLGLAICRKLVSFMGGDIGVFSQPGRGSRFWFTVPLDVPPQSAAGPAEEHGPLAELRLLIVDDNSVSRRFLELLAKKWGIDYSSAANGYKALQMIRLAQERGQPYHLALVDESMPGLGGIELARMLAEDRGLSPLGIILLSHQVRPIPPKDKPTNLVGCVAKPVRAQFLYDCLAKALPGPSTYLPGRATPDETSTHGRKRVLIVEDNRASQQVAIGMLERLGCDTQVAATGQEALDRLRQESFDLILMDCHMPQMDGYEASRRIRTLEGKKGHVPIVAMTANVQEGESDLCIAAGMDDYLAKPLKLDLLRDKIGRWLNGQADRLKPVPASPLYPPSQSDFSGLPALDRTVLNKLREETGEAFGRVIEVFLEDTPLYLQSLKNSIENKDFDGVAELAHCIKGSGRNLGAHRLVGIAKQMEDLDPTDFQAHAAEIFGQLAIEYEIFRAELEHELVPSPETKTADNPHLPCILVADDDRAIRFALLNVLQKDGYRIEQATNGAQALALCERKMPDLVLMDARMPRMDGFTACSKIRELPGGATIPVLIITALDDEHSIERAFSHGATDYIPKPVHFAVLRQRVARMLDASRAQQHVTRLANQDALTGLPNRTQFRERLDAALSRNGLSEPKCHAVLFLDLDRFKLANDTMGHEIGDLLLKTAATRIQECLRDEDMVSRFGGDEFTLFLDDVGNPETAAGIAEAICKAMAKPFSFAGRDIYLSTSIGIAMYPSDGTDSGTLIKHADMAMFRAKERGNTYRFFEDAMASAISKKLRLESDLRRALEHRQFLLHYQPQFNLSTGEMIGMEALVRWQHPDFGLVPPVQFIALAEESGFIEDLGEWVLLTACRQNKAWQDKGLPKITVAVNLSARQLDMDFETKIIRKILADTGLEPRYLELELTESTVMKDPAKTRDTLRRLKEAGISISIDDFGTGYSSLNHLKHFAFDKLKIDQSFIRDVHNNAEDAGIVLTIIAMARTLRLRVIAEGVETLEQLKYLQRNHCDEGQGNYFSKPLTPAEIEELFRRQFSPRFSSEPVLPAS